MTVFELIAIYETRIAVLSRYLRLLHAGRRRNGSAIAHRVRRRLIAALTDMIEQDRENLAAEQRYVAGSTDAERREDELCSFFFDDFADTWNGYRLLERIMVDGKRHRIYDFEANAWWPIHETFPLFVPVTDPELGDLGPMRREIEADLGVSFVIERICYNEDDAVRLLAGAPIGAYGIARLAGEPPS